jgi:D-3-phosphoglycerate dehydrogenase
VAEAADILSLHLALAPETKGIVNRSVLNGLKPGSYLINTARGGIVDEDALKHALLAKRLAGAAFDVFGEEPPEDRQLLSLDNFVGTPHIGGGTEEAVLAMGRAAIAGLDDSTREIHRLPNPASAIRR